MTKIKVIDIEKIYNFAVVNLFYEKFYPSKIQFEL